MSDNLVPFRNPDCSCEWWPDESGVTVLETCPVHGEGTDYWTRQTEEMQRMKHQSERP